MILVLLYILYNIVNTHDSMVLWGIKLLPDLSCSSNANILKRKKKNLCNATIEIDSVWYVDLLLSLNQKNTDYFLKYFTIDMVFQVGMSLS